MEHTHRSRTARNAPTSRAVERPSAATPADAIVGLQRSVGNQAVSSLMVQRDDDPAAAQAAQASIDNSLDTDPADGAPTEDTPAAS